MRTKVILRIGLFSLAASIAAAFPTGAPQGHSGAPGEQTCVQCHGGTANSGQGSVKITFANGTTVYIPGQTVRVTVTVSDPAQQRWGFQASPRVASDAQNTGAGTMAPADANTQIAGTKGTLQWITHTLAGTRLGTPNGASFDFDWTAPSTDVGDVTFYVAGNAANGNNAPTGDLIYTTTATLKASTGPLGGQKPSIRAENGVVNGASFTPGLVPGSWFTVFGSNFGGGAGRTWRADEIKDGKLPTALDGIGVMVNGKPAAISYISDGQINAQAPDDDSTGTVNVVVTTPNGSSDPLAATLEQSSSPALFLFDPQSRKYAAALIIEVDRSVLLGPPGLFGTPDPAGTVPVTRPARPGESVALFGTGFGKTDPPTPSGMTFSGAASFVSKVTVTIGGVDATVLFGGISAPGLAQINVMVPQGTPDGDQPVVVMIDGRATQNNVFLAVQH